MSDVIGIHLVCRDGRGVTKNPDGTFSTRAWKVRRRHAETALYVALHQSRYSLSYLQGRVVSAHQDPREPHRLVIVFESDDMPRRWEGKATGEKGYLRRRVGTS